MTKNFSVVPRLVVALVLVTVACRRERPTPEAPAAASAQKPAQGAEEGGSLQDRLDRESTARPAASLGSERVYEALAKSGVVITERTQVLAEGIGARYCQNARTSTDLVLTVCEFESDAAAEAGKAKSLAFAQTPNRQVLAHHATTLQIIESPKTETSAKLAAAAGAAFSAL